MNLIKTILPNQLVQNGNFEDTSNWNAYNCSWVAQNNVAIITIASGTANQLWRSVNIIQNGHKYYIAYSAKASNTAMVRIRISTDAETDTLSLSANTEARFEQIFNSATTGTEFSFFVNAGASLSVGDVVRLKNVICVDLTLLYGQGLEPTSVAQFRADYPLDYYPYSLTNTTGLLTCANGAITADISSMLPSGIGVVDLGKVRDITRITNGSVYIFDIKLDDMQPTGYATDVFSYGIRTQDIAGYSLNNGCMSRGTGSKHCFIRYDSCLTVPAFLTAMAGQLLFYKKDIV